MNANKPVFIGLARKKLKSRSNHTLITSLHHIIMYGSNSMWKKYQSVQPKLSQYCIRKNCSVHMLINHHILYSLQVFLSS